MHVVQNGGFSRLEEWQTADETGRSKVCGNGQPTEIEVQVLGVSNGVWWMEVS